ncbi:hypothetical protein ACSW8Q_17975 (plasmid) [Clostridium perfringens]|uniref:hypothetical protein n=1 Tax=Clostridium perfringens TaxID=1502 RepID=UPI0013E2DED9|nr:hypothetical protein [Clostridium perfringens]MDB2046487.1 hypothetical protein [Clostridium perfringens]MDB2057087.1 hypothetical protein [Clostridium perfringens]NGT07392.1 hypothetical protein [Clostridium perfringens]
MSIFDKIVQVGGVILQGAMESHHQQMRNMERKLQKAEKKLENGKYSSENAEKVRANIEKYKNKLGGKTIDEWDRCWRSIGALKDVNLSAYNHDVGLYMMQIGSQVVYIGRAVEYNNGGFRKRLSDYRREGNSARKHTSGRTINENLDKIQVSLLIVGQDEEAATVAKRLEPLFIGRYKPIWNKQFM